MALHGPAHGVARVQLPWRTWTSPRSTWIRPTAALRLPLTRPARCWGPLDHASGCPEAELLRPARSHTDHQLDRHPLPMQDRAMMLRNVPWTGSPVEWSPEAPFGRPVGAQIPPSQPAAIRPAGRGQQGMEGATVRGAAGRAEHSGPRGLKPAGAWVEQGHA
jgi:hypothetical protein